MPNTLERIRLRAGISRPEMLRAIGAREGREGPFTCEDNQIDPIFVRRAYELENLYDTWKQETLQAVADAGMLSAKGLAKLLGTYPMKLLRIRYLGLLGGESEDGPSYRIAGEVFTVADMEQLFAFNETFLAQTQGLGGGHTVSRRAPLSGLFVNWLAKRQGTYLRRGTAPPRPARVG